MTTMQRISNFFLKNKQDVFIIVLLSLISFVYIIPLLLPGFILGHDSQVQLASAAARIEAIKDGQFPVRWAGDLNYGYGNPSFIFYYSLGGYLVSLLYFMGFGLETAYELLLGFSLILASVFFYIWAKQIFKKDVAFIGALFYGLSPYVFLDVYVRTHLGESMSLAFIPLVLYFIEKNFKKISLTNIVLGGITYALFIHSHAILSFMFSFLFVAYILFKSRFKLKSIFLNISVLILGLILSAYFWIPSIIEGKYINSKLFLSDWYAGHFLGLKETIYSAWGFGSNVNEVGGLSPQVGILPFLFIVLAIWMFIRKTKLRKHLFFWLVVFAFGIFMSTNYSNFLWGEFHILQKFQFPWRFIALTALSTSVLVTYFFSIYNNRVFKIVVVIVLLILSIPMTRIPKSQSFGDNYYFNYVGTTTFHNEATTIWLAGDPYEIPKKKIEIIAGVGKLNNFQHKSQLHSFSMNNKTHVNILDNTVYFPGWKAEVDGKKVPIEFQDNNHKGFITFKVPQGKHKVEVKFGESPVRLISDMISLFGILIIVFLLVSKKWIKRYLKI